MKKIVIISGVTGAIGSTLLAEYGQDINSVIYGISRKAVALDKFIIDGKLPQRTLICGLSIPDEYEKLFTAINYSDVEEVTYIHAVGLYPFEVNKDGIVTVENDNDGDGINDETWKLTYEAFTAATSSLAKYWSGKTKAVIFGGIADIHEPAVHQSWWKTIKKVKDFMKESVARNPLLSMLVFNISSVLCPHEIITRPFVFIHTDADQTRWLHPYELAQFVVLKTNESAPGFYELDKFRIKEGFKIDEYYKDATFTPRKVDELF